MHVIGKIQREMPRIKRYITYLTLTLLASLSCHAQLRYNVYVTNDKGAPLGDVVVYSFALKKHAQAAFKEGERHKDEGYYFDNKRHNVVESVRTDNDGKCVIKVYKSGAIILDGFECKRGNYDFKGPYNIEDYINKSDLTDNNLHLKLSGKDFDPSQNKESLTVKSDNDTYTLRDDALIHGDPPAPPVGIKVPPIRHGNIVDVDGEFVIDNEYARSGARFVGFPFIEYEDYPDSITYIAPAVVDGKDYERSMERRMSFDKSRDKLDTYHFDASMKMRDHQKEILFYSKPVKILKGTLWKAPALIWYEDNNAVYHRDSILFNDGKEAEPMRFLNWESARKFVDFDRTKYIKTAEVSSIPKNESFKIGFDVGKASVNFGDSLTSSEHSKMLTWLQGYYDNENGTIDNIIVRGYSSPEGTEALNRKLSKDRAATIIQTLRARFPEVGQIIPSFDSYDNIVPWNVIADTMMLADDSISRSYAQEIETRIQGKTTITEQNAAVRANPTLYDYIKEKNLLSRMRRVEIEANIVEQRELTQDEIIQKYAQDSTFRTRMAPYQYYIMMCHLADIEDWNELYKVSKEAYAKGPKVTNITKHVLVPVEKEDSLGIKHIVNVLKNIPQQENPYPLAGYYLALSSMRKGIADTDILKPYLDDGRVNRGGDGDMNNLAFIVAQVLMYCQKESFDEAKDLIEKYNLLSYKELSGLVMFVRCLNGEYTKDPAVRDYIMSTSEMNKAVILTAMGKFPEALNILYNGDVPRDDAKVEYLKAICHFQKQDYSIKKPDMPSLPVYRIWNDEEDEENDDTGINTSKWAAPMLEAFRLEPSNVKYIERDGYFNDAYRKLVLYFWTRMQAGVPQEKIANEYNMLIKRQEKEKETKTKQ